MRLYEVYESDNSIYMIVELIQGGQLYSKIQSKCHFAFKEVKNIMQGLLGGLEYMASRDILHRDLKPENILFRNTALDVVICDFGLATWVNEPEYIYVRCGTPGYVAPEIVNIKDMKTKSQPISDVFSAGLIFHILLFSKSVFKGKNYNEILSENRACNYKLEGPPYSTAEPDALDLLARMLQKNPALRISAAEALRHPFFKKEEGAFEAPKGEGLPASKSKNSREALKPDSCVKFVVGKDGGFTGKTESVSSVDSQKHMDSPGMIKNIGKNRKAPEKSRFNKYAEAEDSDEDERYNELMKMA
jgi:serine/threonine protein kinase